MCAKVTRKSATRWEESSERALIEVWQGKLSDLRGCRKNSHVLQEMVVELQGEGLTFTVAELKSKMHNMTARYRKEKQKMGTTGGSPSEWDLFKEMDMLLAPYKSYNCEGLVFDNIDHINSAIIYDPVLDSPPKTSSPVPVEPPPLSPPSSSDTLPFASSPIASHSQSSLRSVSGASSVRAAKKKQMECQEQMVLETRRLIDIEEEKKNLLKAYIDREAEVQKALVEFLKRP